MEWALPGLGFVGGRNMGHPGSAVSRQFSGGQPSVPCQMDALLPGEGAWPVPDSVTCFFRHFLINAVTPAGGNRFSFSPCPTSVYIIIMGRSLPAATAGGGFRLFAGRIRPKPLPQTASPSRHNPPAFPRGSHACTLPGPLGLYVDSRHACIPSSRREMGILSWDDGSGLYCIP